MTSRASPLFTEIPYVYRDANNYRSEQTIVLHGTLNPADLEVIASKLSGGEFFIPGDLVGVTVAELQPKMSNFPQESDDVWHELHLDELTTVDAVRGGCVAIPAAAFVAAFAGILHRDAWKVQAARERLSFNH